ncbi:MAG TPA: ATP-binding protein [Kofleriaceae bacterium]
MTSIAPIVADFDCLPLAGWIAALDGTVVEANRVANRLVGPVIGEKLWRFAPEIEARWIDLVPALVSFGAYIIEVDLAGGLPVQIQAALREHGGTRYVLAFATDLSAMRARAEAERQRATGQRLESLGLVAGGIAHELNNQLVSVIAESGNLREDEAMSADTKEALGRVEQAAKRMARLTRQLLAYAGRGRFVTSLLDPDALLAEREQVIAQRMPKGATLAFELGAGTLAVEADGGLLVQVIRDLVDNAIDALRGAHGRVAICSRVVSEADRRWWELEINDDGIGMDAATQARIFDPFFSTKQDRHGLGLSAALGIVRRLGGDIAVETLPGRGATFRVRLPVVASAPPPRRRTTSEHPSVHALAGLTVLVADDEPTVRATVQRLLQRRAANAVLARDGGEAEELLRSRHFDVVLLDVMMPNRTGYELVPIARATQPTAPVILMSGYSEQAANVEPPDAFLEKPFNGNALEEAIRNALAGIVANGHSA